MIAIWLAGLGLVGWVWWELRDRKRLRRLAESRPPSTWEEFNHRLVEAGMGADTAAFIAQEFAFAYRHRATPYPEDRVFSVLEIDAEDVEDTIERYWLKRGWVLPSRSEPKLLPGDPSLIELAVWLEREGRVSAGTDEDSR